MKTRDIEIYHPTHQWTRPIAHGKYSRSCPRCKQTNQLGNEALSKVCTDLDKNCVRKEDIEAPDCLVSKVVFGLDGVLAGIKHRTGEYDKKALELLTNDELTGCEDKYYEDEVLWPQVHLLNNLIKSEFYSVEIWTQRRESAREFTEMWLYSKAKIDKDKLVLRMRPFNDPNSAEETMQEWLDSMEIKPVLAFHHNPKVSGILLNPGINAAHFG